MSERRRPTPGSGRPRPGQRGAGVRREPRPTQEDQPRREREREPEGLGGGQIEGRQAVRELLRAGRRGVREVLIADGRDASPIVDEITQLARSIGVPVRLVATGQLAMRARSEVPQGVLAFADPVEPVDLAALTERIPGAAAPFIVVLDGVTDPHNLGSILRSAVSAGATGAVLPKHRSAHLTPTVAKAAAGAIEYLPIALVPGIGAALEAMRRAGVWSIGLDEGGDREVDDLPLSSEPVALVLGAEGKGLAALTRKRCDVLARVPLAGPIDSLNVAAAGAVAFFSVARQRRALL